MLYWGPVHMWEDLLLVFVVAYCCNEIQDYTITTSFLKAVNSSHPSRAPLLNPILPLSSVPPQLLMNKVLTTPHDPYVTMDNTFWPPYIELLLRYGIAVRHQENNFKIRLETFF